MPEGKKAETQVPQDAFERVQVSNLLRFREWLRHRSVNEPPLGVHEILPAKGPEHQFDQEPQLIITASRECGNHCSPPLSSFINPYRVG